MPTQSDKAGTSITPISEKRLPFTVLNQPGPDHVLPQSEQPITPL